MAFFEVSEEPGLGIELNDEIVMRSQRVEIK
jgi:L-alanine-DL-glutamate epimerase-like enolase superfamily enzyme